MKETRDFKDIVVFGARGHSLMLLREFQELQEGGVRPCAVVDDLKNGFVHPVLGVPVISSEERLEDYADIPVFLAPGDASLRARVYDRLEKEGATLATAIAPGQFNTGRTVQFGPGCICGGYVRIGPNVSFGKNIHILSTLVAHDVQIGDFSNLGVFSSVLGYVEIGREVNIAPHAVIGNGAYDKPLKIGDGAVIGVGAVVVKDVPAGAQVGGNPAMLIDDWKKLGVILNDA